MRKLFLLAAALTALAIAPKELPRSARAPVAARALDGVILETPEETPPSMTYEDVPFPVALLLADSLKQDPPPDVHTPAPTAEEWADARMLPVHYRNDRCQAFRIREWLRLSCKITQAQQVAMYMGSLDGVKVGVRRPRADRWFDTEQEIVIPLRRGDRRLFGVTGIEFDRYGPGTPSTDLVVSEQWIDGSSPVVAVR
jgi:hypothetical protein